MNLYSGMQSITVKHVNALNETRENQYDNLIKIKAPFIENETKKESKKNEIDSLVDEYKKYIDSLESNTGP